MSLRSAILAAGAVALAQSPATLTSCGGVIRWTNITLNPTAPQAGDTIYINATGVTASATKGGNGGIDALVNGIDMFQAPITTCGLGQQIDIYGLTTATLDMLSCPTAVGETVALGVVVPIPGEAGGLGQLNITLVGNDTSTVPVTVYCFDVSVTL